MTIIKLYFKGEKIMSKKTKTILCLLLTLFAPSLGLALLVITLMYNNGQQKDNHRSTKQETSRFRDSVNYETIQNVDKSSYEQNNEFRENVTKQNEVVGNYNSNNKDEKVVYRDDDVHCYTELELALAENKKITIITAIVSVALAICSIVFEFIDGEFFSGLSVFCLIAWLLASIIVIVVMLDKKRIKRSHCPVCGEHYDYENDISWETLEVTLNDKGEEYAKLEFICDCSNCGERTSFIHVFSV